MRKIKTPADFFRKPTVENPIDTTEDIMRKLQDIYNNSRTSVRDKLAAIDLHNRLQDGINDRTGEGEKD